MIFLQKNADPSQILSPFAKVLKAVKSFSSGGRGMTSVRSWAPGPRLCPSAVSAQSDRPNEARPWLNGISDIHLIINSQAGALAIFFEMSMFSCCIFEDCNVVACFVGEVVSSKVKDHRLK